MKGLELSEKYYEAFGKQMIHESFPELEDRIATGLVGEGSECFGFDDGISTDHDFEPGFCMFIPSGLDSKTVFNLERAYSKLPKEFEGFKRQTLSPTGGGRHGVIEMCEFYTKHTGFESGPETLEDWLGIPEYALSEATNGKVFRDDLGEFTAIRNRLMNRPEEIRLKKLAGNLLLMAQSGQYNYGRCLKHGEKEAAQLAMCEFVKHTMSVFFLLEKRYQPYYKWSFRALRESKLFSGYADVLYCLISTDNEESYATVKGDIIEDIASAVIAELQNQKLTDAICGDLEKHAYSVNDKIKDSGIRNRNILTAIE